MLQYYTSDISVDASVDDALLRMDRDATDEGVFMTLFACDTLLPLNAFLSDLSPTTFFAGLAKVRSHRLWQLRESNVNRARKQVQSDLASFGSAMPRQGFGHAMWQSDGSISTSSEGEAAASRVTWKSRSGDGGNSNNEMLQHNNAIVKVRQHRMWLARESSASPHRRARQQVSQVLQGLGTAYKDDPTVGNIGNSGDSGGTSTPSSPRDTFEHGQSQKCFSNQVT